jgi:D-aminoacyl-tRNA deacylase
MRLVVQRVSAAAVRVAGTTTGAIGPGALVLVGIGAHDTPEIADAMADKLAGLRYFTDSQGRTNLDLAAIGGSLLVVSQFTLCADLRRGRRPSFSMAADPALAQPLVERFVDRLRAQGVPCETGRFGAAMTVELTNEGPFTLIVDSATDLAAG